jgi:hypothetical protein
LYHGAKILNDWPGNGKPPAWVKKLHGLQQQWDPLAAAHPTNVQHTAAEMWANPPWHIDRIWQNCDRVLGPGIGDKLTASKQMANPINGWPGSQSVHIPTDPGNALGWVCLG